jgi:hypothetical protein
MRAFVFASIAAAVSLMPLAATGEDAQPAPAATAQPAAATDETRLICRQIVHQGTLGRTECHTARQWNSIREYNQRMIRESQQRGLTANPH